MKKWLWFACWLIVASCSSVKQSDAPKPPQAPVADGYEFIVYVDQLDLHAEPRTDSAVVTTLTRGTHLRSLAKQALDVDLSDSAEEFWRQVLADDKIGWVEDQHIIPSFFYQPFARADELGRQGDAAGMIAAALEALKTVGYVGEPEDYCYSISPDHQKVFLNLEYGEPDNWYRMYPSFRFCFQPIPVIYFEAGRGLVDYSVHEMFTAGIWFKDSRHYAYPGRGFKEEPANMYNLIVLDTSNGVTVNLGECFPAPENKARSFNYEAVDRYVLWRTEEPTPVTVREKNRNLPSWDIVKAYNIDSGEILRLLEPNPETLTLTDVNVGETTIYYTYKVTMVPHAACPSTLKKSLLYKRCQGRYSGKTSYSGE